MILYNYFLLRGFFSSFFYTNGYYHHILWKRFYFFIFLILYCYKIFTIEYILYHKIDKTWKALDTTLHPDHNYNHTGLEDGQRYYYQIQAKDYYDQLSESSGIIDAVPSDTLAPSTPIGFYAKSKTINSITLAWNSNKEHDLQGYYLYRSKISNPTSWGSPIETLGKSSSQYIDEDLDEYTHYYYEWLQCYPDL